MLIWILLIAACDISLFYLDVPLANVMGDSPAWLTLFFKPIALISTPIIYFVLSWTMLFISFYKPKMLLIQRALFNVSCTFTLIMLVNGLLKMLCGRARPTLLLQGSDYGFTWLAHSWEYLSFPSSHTSIAVALATLGTLYVKRYKIRFYLFAALVIISRLALNAHFLSDVIAGAFLGYALTKATLAMNLRYPIIWKYTAGRLNAIKQSIHNLRELTKNS